MKVIVRSTNEGGYRVRVETESLAEAVNIANLLANPKGFAERQQNGSAGISRWRFKGEEPTVIVGNNQIILDFDSEQVSIETKIQDLKGYGEVTLEK